MENYGAINRVVSGLKVLDEKELVNFQIDGIVPKTVVEVESEEEIATLLKSANENEISVIPWGGGTMIDLGNIPKRVDIVVSLRKLNRIIEYSPEDLVVTSESGVTLDSLQQLLSKKGQFLALDPPFSQAATLGGIISSNSFGPMRYLYGGVRDLLLGIKVAGTNGALMKFGGKVVKNVAGYDVKKLFIGSLGTLGIITQTTFRLYAIPEFEESFIAMFNSLDDAFNAIQKILRRIHSSIGIGLSAIEMLDPNFSELLNHSEFIKGYVLAAKVLGITKSGLMKRINELEEITRYFKPTHTFTLNGDEHVRFWKDLQNHPLIASKFFTRCKISTIISRVSSIIGVIEDLNRKYDFKYSTIAHPGLGMLHTYFHMEDYNKLSKVLEELRSYVLNIGYGSSLVIESAPPQVKRIIDVWGPVRKDFTLMRSIKYVFDPRNILSPGRYIGGI
ncbi:MAG: FAD-binding oxidoreductase [Nitrososphaerota archaeon]